MKKRLLSLLLCGVMLFSMCATAAAAERVDQLGELTVRTDGPDSYTLTPENEENEIFDLVIHSGAHITLSGNGSKFNIFVEENARDVVITLDNFTTERPTGVWGHRNGIALRAGSSAAIILVGTNNIRAGWESAAILVPGTAALTIDGEGVLNASINNGSNAACCAVIGAHYGSDSCGNITINGGTINAQSASSNAAAIGTAYWNTEEGTCGTITLNGGTINANAIGGATRLDAVVTGSGKAVVHTNASRLRANTNGFNGIIWDGDRATVYGNAVADGLTIGAGQVLTVPDGATLTVPEGETLSVEGTILLKGSMVNNGAVTGGGQIVTTGGGAVSGGGSSTITPGPCPHQDAIFIPVDQNIHKKVCLLCGEEVARENHREGYPCADCGYGEDQIGESAWYTFDSETRTVHIYGEECLWSDDELRKHSDAYRKWRNTSYGTTSVVIHEGITGIGEETFRFWDNMENLSLPQSLTEIGGNAFSYCNRLRSVVLPPHVTSVNDAFRGCSRLETVCAPEGLEVETGSGVTRLTYEMTGDGAVIKSITLGDGRNSVTLPSELYGKPVISHPHIGDATCSQPGICAACGEEYTLPHSYDDETDATCNVCGHERIYTVTFDSQGGSDVAPAAVWEGGKVSRPANPAKEGYTFGGWFKESSGTTAWNFENDTVTGNVTLCAKWTAVTPPTPAKYAVTVQNDGNGTASASPTSAAQGENITLTATANSGYHFKEWQVVSGGVTISGSSFTMPNSDVTVKAIFEPDPPAPPAAYTVTVNGGTGGGSYEEGATVIITAAVPSGKYFTGWTVDEGGVTLANAGSATTTFTMPAQAVTVTANFQSNSGGGGGGYIPPSTPAYPPVVERPGEGGGTPAVSPSNPQQGSTVTVTPKPDTGYEVDQIIVTDRNGKPVTVTAKPDGTYTFTQPTGKVNIKAIYQPIETPWSSPFTDVAEGDWYYEAVRLVQERGLMNGYSDGRFGPNDTLTRAQLAQILFNKEGRPVVNYLMQYGDVSGAAWYAEAVRWATSQGIVSGYGNGMFGPNDPITREQLAVMLWRYSGCPAATNEGLYFNDTDEISGFALEALRWAVENGVMGGYGDGRLDPQGQAIRAQVAQMLKNFIENQEENA